MELRQLRYFVTVAEELHFGRAAERLTIVQSAVSQQIGRLERELGVTLFDRTPRRVRLTEAGAAFLPAAHRVLDAERDALATVAGFVAGRESVLRVGTSRGLGDRLERILEELARLAPDTRAELVSAATQERLRRVADREWDAAFVRGTVQLPDGLRQVPVWQDRLVVAVSARHRPPPDDARPGPSGVELAGLAGMPLYLTPRRTNPPLVDLVLRACRDAGFEPLPGPPASSLEDTLAAFAAGARGWTVVYAAAARQVHRPRVAFLPVPLALPTSLVLPATGGRAAALLAACQRVASDDPDQ
ncbi:DNA-binding transcriptional LysR family regulator [Actinoplanes octamycinicus]|uniref:DNA-binding transcriptional LysR family regulator n=1 Tax=Actinoplanes octamycinicus TaxID=135948 RepID=A0A7W7M9A5_9ACTN|nr:LysR family transcriptional regulator [Actinoplanes octamycinicus]MBB4741630.1 DNA-binding transcriptional LysR family regulator [Actinoplanes octamycinicus]GIE57182.1 LysR family transcriptional regulator [Actinoplanes octamycinicus]